MCRLFCPRLVAAGVIALLVTPVAAQKPMREEPKISHKQMERLEARIATATAIVRRLEREAKPRGLASGWRQATLETLLPLSLEGLRQVEQQAFNLDALASATKGAAEDPQALGDTNKDLVYTPITPCRFIDTRNAGGKINGVRGFDVDLTGSTYGGVAACDPTSLFGKVPADAIGALAMNVTLFDTSTASTPGFVAVKPAAASPTTSLLNWYDRGPVVQVANQGIVSLYQANSGSDDFVIQTSDAVHIIVDIFGAFIMPQATALQTQHPFESVVVANLAAGELESPVCPAGYALTGGGCFTDTFGHYLSLTYPGGGDNRWACRSHNLSGIDSVLFVRAICSRTPGR